MGVQENLYKDSEEICQMLTRGFCLDYGITNIFYIFILLRLFFFHFCNEHVLISEKVNY